MSDETPTTQEIEQQDVKPTVPLSVVIQSEIKTKLLEQNPQVRESYIQQEVQAKVAQRVGLVQKAMVELATQRKELEKAKPDDVKYDVSGKIVQEFYSKEVIEKRKKFVERTAKVEKALTKALETGDYTELENLVK